MSRPMIEVHNLVKSYGQHVAVNGVSFVVQEGEIFGLLGPNGAGKTTTLSMLAALLPPAQGQITIGGYDLAREARHIKPLIGFVPQDLALYPTLSAWENLAFFGRIYGLHGKRLRERIAAALEMVGLQDRAGDAVRTFSGGMKRRLNIAAGLLHEPRLLFLDEPTVGVDPQSRNFIFEHILQLKAAGLTLLYTTHYMEEAERLCDRVAIMDQGRIVALDTPQGLLTLLGGGVIHLGLAGDSAEALLPLLRALPHVRQVSAQEDHLLKIETHQVRPALLEVIEWCNAHQVSIHSLEMLEPNLESVFLHLTGKRLRD